MTVVHIISLVKKTS